MKSTLHIIWIAKTSNKQEEKPNNKYALLNELDITVQWQIEVFKWLLRYIANKDKPELEPKNVTSILVSADSLIMKDLVEEWLGYMKDHMDEIVKYNSIFFLFNYYYFIF